MIWPRRLKDIEEPVLVTERLRLSPPLMGDFNEWRRLRSDGWDFLSRWEPARDPRHYTRNGFRARVDWAQRMIEDGRAVPLFIRPLDGGPMLGAITLDNIRRGVSQQGTIGYWLGEPHVGKGYMTEAVSAVISYAFFDLDLSRIEAAILPHNSASRKVLESVGFQREALLPAYLKIADQWQDHILYSHLRSDRAAARVIHEDAQPG
ncbi:GNAT family N-acetyltransferase [Paracoccaceae bacterium GXU_MW_L88]